MSHARQLRRLVRTFPQPSGAPRHSQPHVRLALASAAQYLASVPRPLTVHSPAEDESAEEVWQRNSSSYIRCRDIHLRNMLRVALDEALTTLRDSEHARIEAARAVRKAYRLNGVMVHVFGPDWQDVPGVMVGEVTSS